MYSFCWFNNPPTGSSKLKILEIDFLRAASVDGRITFLATADFLCDNFVICYFAKKIFKSAMKGFWQIILDFFPI